MNSLPTIEASNMDNYWQVIKALDPELYLIKVALEETKVNPLIIPRFIRSLANIAYGTGHGVVRTFITNHQVTQMKAEETDNIVKKVVIKEQIFKKI